MPRAAGLVEPGSDIAPEDMLRAQCYRLLARFLSSPPTGADLAAGARLTGDDSDLGLAIAEDLEHQQWLSVAHDTICMVYLELLTPTEAISHAARGLEHARNSGSHHIVGIAAAFLATAFA